MPMNNKYAITKWRQRIEIVANAFAVRGRRDGNKLSLDCSRSRQVRRGMKEN
jgi:hypothetical protein